MTRPGAGATAGTGAAVLALVLAACGSATGHRTPAVGADGLVPATPRALAAVVVEHVDPSTPRRSTGDWSDWGDPPALEAQVDYGVDPEGTEEGETRTVRVTVVDAAAIPQRDRRWWRCRPAHEEGGCEEERVDGVRLLYRWWPGMEEEEGGSYAWMVVRDDAVVRVAYERSDLFDEDPRGLGLAVEPDDLRSAALDPAMGLRTTPEAYDAGAALDHYEGEERPPEEPRVTPTTPQQLATRVTEYLGLRPSTVRRSPLDDLGPDAVGARLTFPASRRYDAFTVDVLTAVGRAPQLDPLPCPVQDGDPPLDDCFAWTRDVVATWTLATDQRPGTLWIIGVHDDEAFNRVESVAVRVTSDAIDQPFFVEPPVPDRLPPMLLSELSGLTADLRVGPEQQRPGG